MSYGLLVLRVVLGLSLFGHGAQKAFGVWGGPGLKGTSGWLASMGFRMPGLMALSVAAAEGSGALLALGFLTPLAAFGLVSAMVVAIASVHWAKGFWLSQGGYEYNLLIIAGAVAVAMTGPGRFSLDRAFHWDDNWSGLWWGVGVFAAGVAAGAFVLTALRGAPPAPAQEG